ncbi:MAG: murein transglycosylase A [Pikeienuella sp.]
MGRTGLAAMAAALWLAAAGLPRPALGQMQLVPTEFAALAGWADDPLGEALPAIYDSCAALRRGRPTDPPRPAPLFGDRTPWLTACRALEALPAGADHAAIRTAIEAAYRPYRVRDRARGETGLVTGYFEPELTGSLGRRAQTQVPLYRAPRSDKLRRQTRAEIAAGGLSGQGLELVWLDDPIAAFFLDIQGSGVIRLAEGGSRRVRYTRFNGYGYTPVGRALVDWGEMALEDVTMQAIIAWMADNPGDRQRLMNVNRSYVYFDWLRHDAPQGSQGVDLTPGRSLAIDPRHIPYGAPLWLETTHPVDGTPIARLMVAQDKGGAIKGVVRADYFWGTGATAGHAAGLMKAQGQYAILLPRGLTVPPAYHAP